MNQAQRTYLIKKVKDKSEITLRDLQKKKPDEPSLSNYLLHAVMSGNFEIASTVKLKKLITEKALKTKKGNTWLNTTWRTTETEITFDLKDFFVVPDEYNKAYGDYLAELSKINTEIDELIVQTDSLVTRITLASDKTLQNLINEVDDMGNLSLMDSTLKLLSYEK